MHPKDPVNLNLLFGDISKIPDNKEIFLVQITEFSRGGFEASLRKVTPHQGKDKSSERKARDMQREIERQIHSTCREIRHKVKELGCDRILTLTRSRGDAHSNGDIHFWQAAVQRFIASLRRIGYFFQYVAVPQRHRSGEWHCHIAINNRINIEDARCQWRSIAGARSNVHMSWHVRDSRLVRVAKIGCYISKTLSDDWSHFSSNARRFWASLGSTPRRRVWIIKARDLNEAFCILASQLRLDIQKILSRPECYVRHSDGDGIFLNYLPGLDL